MAAAGVVQYEEPGVATAAALKLHVGRTLKTGWDDAAARVNQVVA